MKKIICLILAVLCGIAFCSCEKKEQKAEEKGVDISYYVKLGQIPEMEYHLGQNVDEMIKELKEKSEVPDSAEENYYSVFESGDNTTVTVNGGDYLYKTKNKNDGLWAIVSYSDAFGFKIGASTESIKTAVEVFCDESEEEPLSEEERKILSGTDESSCLKYDFDDARVIFAFEENGLFATALFKN